MYTISENAKASGRQEAEAPNPLRAAHCRMGEGNQSGAE